jgi:hypothetical protein
LVETTRPILTDLPDCEQLVSGSLRGEYADHRWQVDVLPFVADFIDPRRPGPWMPQAFVVNVWSPSGRVLRIDTVRLRREQGAKNEVHRGPIAMRGLHAHRNSVSYLADGDHHGAGDIALAS